jgi:hypothetical protein
MPIESFSEADFIALVNDQKVRLENIVKSSGQGLAQQMKTLDNFVAANHADYDANIGVGAKAVIDGLRAQLDTLADAAWDTGLVPDTKADYMASLSARVSRP